MNYEFTLEQFTNKVAFECPFEFLVGEFDYTVNEVENLRGEELRGLISKNASTMSKNQLIGFVELNCNDMNFNKYDFN